MVPRSHRPSGDRLLESRDRPAGDRAVGPSTSTEPGRPARRPQPPGYLEASDDGPQRDGMLLSFERPASAGGGAAAQLAQPHIPSVRPAYTPLDGP